MYIYSIGILGCIKILDIEYDIDDYAVIQWMSSVANKVKRPKRRCKVRYNSKGDAYIITHRQRYYLEDFIRI